MILWGKKKVAEFAVGSPAPIVTRLMASAVAKSLRERSHHMTFCAFLHGAFDETIESEIASVPEYPIILFNHVALQPMPCMLKLN